jgi:hypothetical protein
MSLLLISYFSLRSEKHHVSTIVCIVLFIFLNLHYYHIAQELLVNYYEIESFLRFRAPCFLPQLEAPGPVSFPPCQLPFKTVHVAQ